MTKVVAMPMPMALSSFLETPRNGHRAEELHQDEVVHQYGADKQEQVFGHCDA
jgi:hypothetical protein